MIGEAKGEGEYKVGETPNIGGDGSTGAGDGGGNGEDNGCAVASTVGAADAAAPGEDNTPWAGTAALEEKLVERGEMGTANEGPSETGTTAPARLEGS